MLQEKCVAHIRRRQLADGGWNIYEGGPSEISATVKAYFALKLAGCPPTAPDARGARLRSAPRRHPRMNTYAKLYLALLGQFPWKYLPTVPVEIDLFPAVVLLQHLRDCRRGAARCSMPLAILNHYKPTRQLPPEQQLHELYPVGTEQAISASRWRRPRFRWPNFFLALRSPAEAAAPAPVEAVARTRALARAEAWMTERMGEGSDGLGGDLSGDAELRSSR